MLIAMIANLCQHIDAQVIHDGFNAKVTHGNVGGEKVESGSTGLGGFACYPDCSKGDQSVRS